MASDIDKSTHEVYEKNYGIKPYGDLYEIDEKTIPNYDILCAGFPCEPFSQSGKRKGFKDKRGVLFEEIIRFASYHKPKVLALENVPGLLTHDKGHTLEVITNKIRKIGYEVNYKVIKCSDYGIPQMRKRLIFLCVRNDIKHDIDLFDLSKYEKDIKLSDYLSKNFEKDYAYTIRCGGAKSPIDGRHNWDGYWIDGNEYRLTLDDARKLQGFGDDFFMAEKKKDAWRHLGNTIPTIFTEIIADKIEAIGGSHACNRYCKYGTSPMLAAGRASLRKEWSKPSVPSEQEAKPSLKVVDLFCGCGGFTKGLEDAGLEVLAGVDHWSPAIQSYKENFGHPCLQKDLTEYSPENFQKDTNINHIDLLVGGPPCQGFSMAGRRDQKDPRNALFMRFVDYLNYFKPKMFIMENVRGILSMKTAEGNLCSEIILEHLTKDYNCIPFSLYARDFEVPQIRNRVLFIGIRRDLNKEPICPERINPENRIPVSSVLLTEEEITRCKHKGAKLFLSEKAIRGIKTRLEKMKKKGHGFGAQFLKMDKPSYTIPARYYKDGYDALIRYDDTKIRKLTITELKRIQTLGDGFILCGNRKEQIMQIGNSVAPRFAYHIGKYVIKTLAGERN